MMQNECINIMHICSGYANQKLYVDMMSHLDARGVRQYIYVPVRTKAELGGNRNDYLNHAQYRYAYILRWWHRLLFRTKIRRISEDIITNVSLSRIRLVHAHFLYSDGAVALRIYRQFGVPYVVAVRNTDINYFMRLRPDLKHLCWEILGQARKVIFLSSCYQEQLLKHLPMSFRAEIRLKSLVVPNGMSPYWLENLHVPDNSDRESIRLLYVGEFSKNKNIENILKAAKLLHGQHDISISLVGAGGDGEKLIDRMLASGQYDFAKRLGRIDDRQVLLSIYRDHDIFVMPSFRETFGIAYIEALSQGLPVIFSKGQGIDGYFDDGEVGEAVNPKDVGDIQRKIDSVITRLPKLRERCVRAAQKFNWQSIADTYVNVYQEALK